LLDGAAGKSREELDRFIATIASRPDIRDHIQRLPVGERQARQEALGGQAPEAQVRDSIQALAPGRVHFGFTGDTALHEKIKRARQLLWHKHPQGRLEDIFSAALDALLEAKDPDRQPAPRKPEQPAAAQPAPEGPASHDRYIPRWIRADVWKRDEGRCAYATSDGVRCTEVSGLEYDHIVPLALGGPSDDPANIRLLCRAHNQLLARETFGEKADWRDQGDGTSPGG
jgi:hypothetical protein